MRIEIIIARGRAMIMHGALADRLAAMGHVTRMAYADPLAPVTTSTSLLMTFEDIVYGPLRTDLCAPLALQTHDFEGEPDILVDLANAAPSKSLPALTPIFDLSLGENAMISALLDGRAPETIIALRTPDGTIQTRARGLAAIHEPGRFKESLNRVYARLIDLIAQAITQVHDDCQRPALSPIASPMVSQTAPIGFAITSLAARVQARLTKLSSGGEAWRVAWRRVQNDAVRQTLQWPQARYAMLSDDGQRYFADPFVFARDGTTYVFVEEYPYATNRGLISVFTISADGVASPPRPVLEAPYHLSFPFVFERGGIVYMMPESCAGNQLELYRAEQFPDKWVKERVLIDNIAAADAAIVERDGLLWLFATVGDNAQSDWDSLHLFHANTLEGEWKPHPGNPVLIDASQARAAGHFFEREGKLHRPVQDCSNGYGSALAICRVDRLDIEGFSQSRIARLAARPASAFTGIHTLNEAAGIETIDFLGTRYQKIIGAQFLVNHDDP